jgi:hypothetical protein
MSFKFPRMLVWGVLTLVLMALTLWLQAQAPGNLVAVTLYKAHLLALGGWGGYWLDRALFPYARPDVFLNGQNTDRTALIFAASQLRRVIIVAACLITVGLGA